MSWYGYLILERLAVMLTLVSGLFGVRLPPSLRTGWYLYLLACLSVLIVVKESHWFLT